MPDDSFFLDLGQASGAKSGAEQFLEKRRSEYEKVKQRFPQPLQDAPREHEIDRGLIDDPEEVERWERLFEQA